MKRPREPSPLGLRALYEPRTVPTTPTSGEDISDEGIETLIALLNETNAKTLDPATTTDQTSAKPMNATTTDQTSAKTTDQSTPNQTQLENLDSQMLYDMLDG